MPPTTIDLLANFGKSDESAHIHGNPQDVSTFPSDRQHPFAGAHSSTRSSSHLGILLRSRSRSPLARNKTSTIRLPRRNILGFGLDQIQFIRLTAHRNPQRTFELRRFNFPADKLIEVIEGLSEYRPIPTQGQIVLSTSDGDIFARLDDTDTLLGIYSCDHKGCTPKRAKININSGKITLLTSGEIKGTPVGFRRQISKNYRMEHIHQSHGSHPSAELQLGSMSSPSPKLMPLPNRLPSSDGCGYQLDQIQFIRLIPVRNHSLIFSLQKYTFPADKSILFLERSRHYVPVPMQDLIVVISSADDVFAILESLNHLAGIYSYVSHTGNKVRVKINMRSGAITQLTKHEIGHVPVGRLRPILFNFKIQHAS